MASMIYLLASTKKYIGNISGLAALAWQMILWMSNTRTHILRCPCYYWIVWIFIWVGNSIQFNSAGTNIPRCPCYYWIVWIFIWSMSYGFPITIEITQILGPNELLWFLRNLTSNGATRYKRILCVKPREMPQSHVSYEFPLPVRLRRF